jgi:hypothetical protein
VDLFPVQAAPLFAMRVFSALANLGMPAAQEKGIWIANLRSDNAEIARGIKKTGIPAFPVRQKFFNSCTKVHLVNVYEPTGRDNDATTGLQLGIVIGVAPRRKPLFFENLTHHHDGPQQHQSHDDCRGLRQAEQRITSEIFYVARHDIQQFRNHVHQLCQRPGRNQGTDCDGSRQRQSSNPHLPADAPYDVSRKPVVPYRLGPEQRLQFSICFVL